MDKRISNLKQYVSAYRVEFKGGKEKGINGVLASNGGLEAFFNESNALDISWVKYKGVNISFLSKNGLNSDKLPFPQIFEGGFLYTCGLDNISVCVAGKPMHGSMHYQNATEVCVTTDEEKITVSGKVSDTELFGKNLEFNRCYEMYPNKIVISDTVTNKGTIDTDYILLYHTNFGYPFLDECLKMEIPAKDTIAATEIAKSREKEKFIITSAVDNNPEDLYFHYLKEGKIKLFNSKVNIGVEMSYSLTEFPITWEWKSMASGDYALGIEPTFTRLDDFKMRKLKPGQSKKYKIEILFK